jgi:protein phosphatase
VAHARDAGGSDNITVVVVDVEDDGDGPGRAGDLVASAVGATASQAAAEGTGAGGGAADAAGERSGADDPNPTPTHDSVLVPASQVGATADPRAAGSRVRVRGRSPRVTLRVVIFIVALLAILAGIAAAVWWFGERSYFVGLQGNAVTIYKGRPGGLLWINPTVAQGTNLTTDNCPPSSGKICVPASAVPDLRAGKEEPSLAAAQQYVTNLTQEATSVQSSSSGGPPAAGTTAPAPGPAPTTQKP